MAVIINDNARNFLSATAWNDARCEPLTGDASTRKYFRLRKEAQSAILMDASDNLESVAPFRRISRHLRQIGFSAPAVLAGDHQSGFLLLEDFGDMTFATLLDHGSNSEPLFTLAADVLIALHRHPQAIPDGLRSYDPERMLDDITLFLEWRTPAISEIAQAEFRAVWREVLPLTHQIPTSLLLRDFHAANLMLLPERQGVRQAGLLDFQDAYQGPVSYDLVSLLEDARRDVPGDLKEKIIARYLACFPSLSRSAFEVSMTILAAQRHTRVLAIFERLSRHGAKHDYKQLHAPRVERLLQKALRHPALASVKYWMERYGWNG